MTLHRAFVPAPLLDSALLSGTLELPHEVVHRLTKVLRLSSETRVELFDGAGLVVTGHLDFADATKFVVLEIVREKQSGPRLVLVQALVKQDKLEAIVQDATELGVHQFILFSAVHSVVKVTERTPQQMQRLQKIAIDAARQCERSDLPGLLGPLTLKELIAKMQLRGALILVGEPRSELKLSEMLEKLSLASVKEIMLVIGPEGGLDDAENAEFGRLGGQFVRYAPYVLRTQTAGLVGMSIIQSRLV